MRLHLALIGLTFLVVVGCGGRDGADPARDDAEPAAHGDDQAGAFCEAHQIAEARCVWCNPALVEELGFCGGHGVPEAYCYQCTPALIPAFKAVGDWCAGHDRPESQCYICNPELDPERQEAPGDDEASSGLVPAGDPTVGDAHDPDVPRQRRRPRVYCSTSELQVRLESPDIVRQAGIQTVRVSRNNIAHTVRASAMIEFARTRHAQVEPPVRGTVRAVHRDLGEVVEAGDPLVTISSSELGAAKAAFLAARARVDLWTRNEARERDLQAKGAGTERDLLEAETELVESRIDLSRARGDLQRLGLSVPAIEEVTRTGDTGPELVLRAPFDGEVVALDAAVGEAVDAERPVMAVGDPEVMWALLDVYEEDARVVRRGQPVLVTVDGLPGVPFPGTITWVSQEVDARTRTLTARVELENPDGLLRANMYANAEITVARDEQAVVVPSEAVQWEGCCNVVFVRRSDTLYEPHKVTLGVDTGKVVEVISGVSPGDEVVTEGSFLFKTELLKGSIGAGCCEVRS